MTMPGGRGDAKKQKQARSHSGAAGTGSGTGGKRKNGKTQRGLRPQPKRQSDEATMAKYSPAVSGHRFDIPSEHGGWKKNGARTVAGRGFGE